MLQVPVGKDQPAMILERNKPDVLLLTGGGPWGRAHRMLAAEAVRRRIPVLAMGYGPASEQRRGEVLWLEQSVAGSVLAAYLDSLLHHWPKLGKVLDAAGHGLIVVNQAGRVCYLNAAARSLVGHTGRVVGRPAAEVWLVAGGLLKTASGAMVPVEYARTCCDGAELLLFRRRTAELGQHVLAAVDDVIFTLDTNLRCTDVLGSWVHQYGLDPGCLIGRQVPEVLGGTGEADVHEAAMRRAVAGKRVSYECSLAIKGRNRRYTFRLAPIYNPDRKISGLVAVGRDITWRYRLEQKLAYYNRQLLKANQELLKARAAMEHTTD